MAEDILNQLLEARTLFLLIGGSVVMVAIIAGAITSIVKGVARERTRREIAAYIAEGSLTPEQGERLMAAGEPRVP